MLIDITINKKGLLFPHYSNESGIQPISWRVYTVLSKQMLNSRKILLSCGHDMDVQGPITSTGHDLNQLREVIRLRDDLSMAEKFDMIAKIEEGQTRFN